MSYGFNRPGAPCEADVLRVPCSVNRNESVRTESRNRNAPQLNYEPKDSKHPPAAGAAGRGRLFPAGNRAVVSLVPAVPRRRAAAAVLPGVPSRQGAVLERRAAGGLQVGLAPASRR